MERVRAKPKHSPHFTYRAVPALKIRSCNGFCQIRQPSAENSVCNYVLAASSGGWGSLLFYLLAAWLALRIYKGFG